MEGRGGGVGDLVSGGPAQGGATEGGGGRGGGRE